VAGRQAAAACALQDWLRGLGRRGMETVMDFTRHLPKPLAEACREQAALFAGVW
jgi:hypothetical protein